MYWQDEPATEQQLMHLRNAGVPVSRPLTRTEAARLIREVRKNPARALELSVPANAPSALPQRGSGEPPPPMAMASNGEISESTRMHAFKLREAGEAAHRAQAANPNAPNVLADAVCTANARREFWLDTCREYKEMRIASMQVFELYQRYGCRFFAPNGQQTQEILTALDSALPSWDRDHPELFYQALELNFPQLVRRGLATKAA
ncbi:MAG TPA: hypothetical protein VG167_11300 [Verrucomicrobiae bacterium]|nr:hypothetical protein [Verrucomicrobiae bacterium]